MHNTYLLGGKSTRGDSGPGRAEPAAVWRETTGTTELGFRLMTGCTLLGYDWAGQSAGGDIGTGRGQGRASDERERLREEERDVGERETRDCGGIIFFKFLFN